MCVSDKTEFDYRLFFPFKFPWRHHLGFHDVIRLLNSFHTKERLVTVNSGNSPVRNADGPSTD